MFFHLWLSQPAQFKFLPEFYFPPDLLFENHLHHQRQCWLTISSPGITFTSLTLLLYLLFKYTTNPHTNTEDILCSKIYLTELENQTMEAKMTELKNVGKKQEVFRDEEDRRQLCISVRWVLSQKVKNGENITKARLCARSFKEVNDFPTDPSCCSRTCIRKIFALIVSNQWEIK